MDNKHANPITLSPNDITYLHMHTGVSEEKLKDKTYFELLYNMSEVIQNVPAQRTVKGGEDKNPLEIIRICESDNPDDVASDIRFAIVNYAKAIFKKYKEFFIKDGWIPSKPDSSIYY